MYKSERSPRLYRSCAPALLCLAVLTTVACQSDDTNLTQPAAVERTDQSATPATTAAAPNPRLGRRSFLRCRSCHSLDNSSPALIGPNLGGLFGRTAGTAPDFPYSDALLNSNLVWDEQTLREWLANPAAYLPGNRMVFEGVADKAELDALIAFLKSETTSE